MGWFLNDNGLHHEKVKQTDWKLISLLIDDVNIWKVIDKSNNELI